MYIQVVLACITKIKQLQTESLCFFVSGGKLGFTIDLGKLHNVSLGQGQEAVAEVAMEKAAKEGHWVILQVCLHERWSCTE